MMQRKVLVPLDGSTVSEQMLPWVRALAERLHLAVCLVQVLDPSLSRVNAAETGEDAAGPSIGQPTALRYLTAVADDLRAVGIRAATSLEYGDAVGGILEAAHRERVDLIAMSTHGRSGIGRWLYGSVAECVLRGAAVPVLLYRAQDATAHRVEPARQDRRLLVPLDGSALAVQVLPAIASLLAGLDLQVTLLGVVVAYLDQRIEGRRAEALAILSRQVEWLRRQGIRAEARVEVGRPAEWIVVEARQIDATLIAMATHARTGLDRISHGSVADQVLRTATVPVLMVRGEPTVPGIQETTGDALRRTY